MTDETFNKYQWSIFTGTDRSQQYVVRSNDFAEFEKGIDEVLNRISDMLTGIREAIATQPTTPISTSESLPIGKFTAPVPAATTTGTPVCAVHNKPMRSSKYGWYCSTKLPDGSWCKYKVK